MVNYYQNHKYLNLLISESDLRYQNTLEKSIKRAPNLNYLLRIAFHFSIINSRIFCVLWFL